MTDPSQFQPLQNPPEPPVELAYETPPAWGNAPLLVRLAAIFAFVTTGLDVVHALVAGGAAGFMYYTFTHMPVAPAGGAPAPALPMPPIVFCLIYAIPAALSLLVIGFKLVGAIKLIRLGRNAWGWGLATAILQCTELWQVEPCCVMFILPLGAGVYTIIILCMPHVRRYLQQGTSLQSA